MQTGGHNGGDSKSAIIPKGRSGAAPTEDDENGARLRQREQAEGLAALRKKLAPALIFAAAVAVISIFAAFNLALPSSINPALSPLDFAMAQLCLSLPVFWAGRDLHRRGLVALCRFSPSVDSLMALVADAALACKLWSVCGIYYGREAAYGSRATDLYFEAAVMALALALLGEYLKLRARGKASAAFKP